MLRLYRLYYKFLPLHSSFFFCVAPPTPPPLPPDPLPEEFSIDSNKEKLNQISKIVFPHIEHYSLKTQLQVFHAFGNFGMLDPIVYRKIEKNLLRHLNTVEVSEMINFLIVLGGLKNCEPSKALILFLQNKITKKIGEVTPAQLINVIKSYQKLGITDQNMYKIFLNYFNEKIGDITVYKGLNIMILLVRSRLCEVNSLFQTLESFFKRILLYHIDKLSYKEISLIYFIYFTKFLSNEMLDKDFMKYYKFLEAKSNLGNIFACGLKTEFTDLENTLKSFDCFDFKENFKQNGGKISDKLSKLIKNDEEKKIYLNCLEVCSFIQSYNEMNLTIPNDLMKLVTQSVEKMIMELTPKEFYTLLDLITNIKNQKKDADELILTMKKYFDLFLKDLNSKELCELWKRIDFHNVYQEIKPKIRELFIKEALTFCDLDDYNNIFLLSLKELKQTNDPNLKNFLLEVLKNIAIYVQTQKTTSKQLMPLLKLIMAFPHEGEAKILKEIIGHLRKNNKVIDAEDFINIENFLAYYGQKYEDLRDEISKTQGFLSQKYLNIGEVVTK